MIVSGEFVRELGGSYQPPFPFARLYPQRELSSHICSVTIPVPNQREGPTACNTIRGDGLFRLYNALAVLEEDSLQLDRTRRRIGESLPPYTSHQSHNSTISQTG